MIKTLKGNSIPAKPESHRSEAVFLRQANTRASPRDPAIYRLTSASGLQCAHYSSSQTAFQEKAEDYGLINIEHLILAFFLLCRWVGSGDISFQIQWYSCVTKKDHRKCTWPNKSNRIVMETSSVGLFKHVPIFFKKASLMGMDGIEKLFWKPQWVSRLSGSAIPVSQVSF